MFAFLLCHTGGAGLFVLNVFRAFSGHSKGIVGMTVNVFLEDSMATTGLEMKYSALLLAAINSSVNIVLYCLFLPSFRRHWILLVIGKLTRTTGPQSKEPTVEITQLEEMQLSRPDDVSSVLSNH